MATPAGYERIRTGPSAIHGTGIFAAEDLRAGELIFRRDFSRVIDDEHPLRPELGEYEWHCDDLPGGRQAYLPYPERHSNHSCEPNSYDRIIDGETWRVALRDIPAGEELTVDYCINSRGDVTWRCNCGAPRCRRVIHSDFFRLPIELQIEYLPLLKDWFVEENRELVEPAKKRSCGPWLGLAHAGEDSPIDNGHGNAHNHAHHRRSKRAASRRPARARRR